MPNPDIVNERAFIEMCTCAWCGSLVRKANCKEWIVDHSYFPVLYMCIDRGRCEELLADADRPLLKDGGPECW